MLRSGSHSPEGSPRLAAGTKKSLRKKFFSMQVADSEESQTNNEDASFPKEDASDTPKSSTEESTPLKSESDAPSEAGESNLETPQSTNSLADTSSLPISSEESTTIEDLPGTGTKISQAAVNTLNLEDLDYAKSLVLDLLGWGVHPEYLVACGVSPQAVLRIFTDLHLRIPPNLEHYRTVSDMSVENRPADIIEDLQI